MPRLLGMLLLLSTLAAQAQDKALTQEEQKLADEAKRLNQDGRRQYNAGKFVEADIAFRRALQLRQQLYPPDKYPDGHLDLATSLNNLAGMFMDQGRYDQAEPLYRQALVITQKHYTPDRFPQGHLDLALALNNLAMLLQDQGQLSAAEVYSRDALAVYQKLFPAEHFPAGHPDLAAGLSNLAMVLDDQGKVVQAEPLLRQALAMYQKHYPPERFPAGHPYMAACLSNLASVLMDQGRTAQAESYYRDALAMYQKLYPAERYPEGHANLADSMDNLAKLLKQQGRFVQAESLYRQVLAMRQKLYPTEHFPQGHPRLAQSLSKLAMLLQAKGQFSEAEQFSRQALAMSRKLYPPAHVPEGHLDVAGELEILASLLDGQGKYAESEDLYRQALAMYQKLYPTSRFPEGHPHLARIRSNFGFLLLAQRKLSQAEPLFCQALAMYHRMTIHHAEVRGEGEVLMLLTTQPRVNHFYLSVVQQAPELATSGYSTLWTARSILTRLAEQKHLAVRVAAVSPDFRQQWEQLVSLKRQRANLLLAPPSPNPETGRARKQRLEEWGRQINDLSVQVRDRLTAWHELQRQDNSSPADLQKLLPKDVVFIDLLRYTFFDFDPAKPGKDGEKQSPRYVAFVVTKNQIHHVDLGPAEPLEAAVKQWRESITTKHPPHPNTPPPGGREPERNAPATLRRLLWEPLEKHFPAGTTTVYLCPDQMLCFLPWAALPGKKADTVLLEDYTLALVPHGPYLLGQLLGTKEKEEKKVDLLVLGGVKYDDAPVQATVVAADRGPEDPKVALVQAAKGSWPYLQGTASEAEAIRKLAQQRQLKTQLLSDREAGTERFKQELPKARIAHLATHGFFADPKFRSVFQMDEKLFVMRGNERIGAGALLPSLLSGLVFAGANRPETPGRGIVTAEELFDLDLTSMELAVLSACETGLGDVGGGEGVFGLQRAFHVVGCQNVIASLWKVNDAATVVLMEEFYRNLWEKKLSKREALRQAQLTLYRNPDLVAHRAKEMGLRGIDDVATPLPAAAPGATRRSPPAWWAAFLLSGLGE